MFFPTIFQIMQATYNRLKERRLRLDAVKNSMDAVEHGNGDFNDVVSVISEPLSSHDGMGTHLSSVSQRGRNHAHAPSKIIDNLPQYI